eukprot:CAMPEP_0206143326 /NCGR_PEP_ID=MMETSP1473-20131121/20137_1 /ASSEMBLY_ACC=CAM_ASM_001109 /TAXON_ID=1461547 /ORGANISM="Stichococcus sp, Strain RCC1054" /LENGTH=86 /DNA_ID=CAMNT_0053538667 /DNA_START=309 /DNA_END=567 /DNA_ORIENTATION=-
MPDATSAVQSSTITEMPAHLHVPSLDQYTTRTLFDVGQSPKAYDAALLPPYISSQRHKNSYMLQQCSLDPEIEDFYLDQHVLHVCE